MNNPFISIIMLTFNRENYIARAIDSVLRQTYRNFEFIIVNNGSTDNSGNIADEYASKDARIKVIHKERGSIGSGRNVGLANATGEYLAFIDDDDYCTDDFIEFLYILAVENDADVSICGDEAKVFNVKLIMSAEEAVINLLHRKYYNVAFPTKMFKSTLKEKIFFPEEDSFDDITTVPVLLANANKVAYHGSPKYTFYRHERNNSAWTTNHQLLNSKILNEYLMAYKDRTVWLTKMFPNSSHTWRYFEWSFMLSMVEKINRFNISDCAGDLKTIIFELKKNRDEFLCSEHIQNFEIDWMKQYADITVV